MTASPFTKASDLLINLNDMKFLHNLDDDSHDEKDVSMAQDVNDISIDDISGAPLTYFSKDQPIQEPIEQFKGEHKFLKFKINPVFSNSLAFVSGPGMRDTKLYTAETTLIDKSAYYKQYVSRLFEIYQDLGDDRLFTVLTIGLINHSSRNEHLKTMNLALEALVDELEILIESKRQSSQLIDTIELEDCLSILNCLKTIHFTIDSNEKDSTAKFFIHLKEWINRTDGEPSEQVIEETFTKATENTVYETTDFWKLVNQLLLRGLFDQAIGTLEKSNIISDLENKCENTWTVLKDIISLLREYPYDAEVAFREWKSAMLQLSQFYLETETKVSPGLRDFITDMIYVLSGTQAKIVQYSRTWYECFCGLILYYIPTLELSEEYLQLSLDSHPLDVCSNWEQACTDIIRGKIFSILPVLDDLDGCTAAFTSALCEAKGLLDSPANLAPEQGNENNLDGGDLFSSDNSMASYLLNSFALELCCYEDRDLWAVAMGMLALSPSNNESAKRLAIAELLPHYPFRTNDDIEWLFTICAKWRLPDVAKTIYRILGNDLLYQNNVVEAMTNFSKAGEFEWVKHYSWMIFEASVMQGAPLEDMVINAIVSDHPESEIPIELLHSVVTDVMKQTLSPYAVLYQFYRHRDSQNWDEALDTLLHLLEFTYLPPQYCSLLIARFLNPLFLEDDSKRMPEESVVRIMRVVQNLIVDEKCIALYEVLKTNEQQATLPQKLSSVLSSTRQRLSFKICQGLM
ncbi:LAFE_0F12024g1_1 [Lachancea fermentati]|uniref:Nuclear pore complex protein Nup85 n=1 Tax=Lachancea fermentati TaxID=4955 RepID=A0A1G4MFW3_LACFM|nr:LAFE_0F12024g1_1 [Lachancea fermentati]